MPINLGQITFGIGADTQRLRSSIQDITAFGTAVERAAASTAAGSAATANAFLKQERAAISALQKVQKFQDAVSRTGAPEQLISGLNRLSTRNLDLLTQRMTQGRLSTIQFQREIERFGQHMSNAERIVARYVATQRQAEGGPFASSLQKLAGAAVLVAGPLSGIATRLSVIASLSEHFSLAWAGMIGGMAAGAAAFYGVSKAAIAAERSIEQVSQTLQAVSGSSTIANLQLKYIADLSMQTGVAFDVLAKQYGQLQAASKGTNLEGERTRKVFEGIVYASAKLGMSSEEAAGSLLAIQQMISKGVISAEELKGQLGDRLPGAVQIMAASLGVTTQKLAKMMKAGEVGASALVKFTETLVQRYNVDTAAKIDTIAAAEGRLTTARMVALDNLDKIIGFSSAYKNVLNSVADALANSGNVMPKVIAWLAAIAAGLAAAFTGQAVIAGLGAITAGVIALTTAVVELNTASMMTGVRSLIGLVVKLGLAVAGGVAAYKFTTDAMENVKKSYLSATPAVEEYLKAQEKMVSSDRKPTEDYLKSAHQRLEVLQALREEQAKLLEVPNAKLKLAEGLGATQEQLDTLWKTFDVGPKMAGLQRTDAAIANTKKNLAGLQDLYKRQTQVETHMKPDPAKEASARSLGAVRKAQEEIRTLQAHYNNLFMSPAARQQAEMLEDVTHSTERFKESLVRAQIPASQLTELVKQYHDSLLKLREGEIYIRNHVSSFQMLSGFFSHGIDQGLNSFIDVLVDGKDKMEAFGDTVKFVVKDILKTMLQLSALNPLKNFLFGLNTPTLGGTSGIGGMVGSLFSSGLHMPKFANGGIMSSGGEIPLRRYAAGGIASSPQMALFGEGSKREAYVPLPDGRSIPVSMTGGGSGVELHIHEAPGTKVTQQTTKSSNGGMRVDAIVQQLVRDAFHSDVASGGPISRSMEKQFGLNRAKGIA
jgi:tape measure domain-containing protein